MPVNPELAASSPSQNLALSLIEFVCCAASRFAAGLGTSLANFLFTPARRQHGFQRCYAPLEFIRFSSVVSGCLSSLLSVLTPCARTFCSNDRRRARRRGRLGPPHLHEL